MKFMRKVRTRAKQHKKRLIIGATSLLAAFAVAILANYIVIGRYGRYILDSPAQVTKTFGRDKPVAIVFGGGITDDDKPMLLLQYRLEAAVKLLQEGRIGKIMVSGDNRFKKYDEPTVMRNYLVHHKGINPDLVQPDFAGRSTYETCERARKVFGLTNTVLISESTHLSRAIFLCRSFGIEAHGFASDTHSTDRLKFWQRWREVFARTKATLNVYVMGEQTVLGEKIWQTTLDHNPLMPPATPNSYVQNKLTTMSLRDKVASLFIVHTPGTNAARMKTYMAQHKVSGLIFMNDNIPATIQQVRKQANSLTTNNQFMALTAVDEEGGTVKRLQGDRFPGADKLRGQPPQASRSTFSQRSDLLRQAGLNLNFGIVADVSSNKESFIHDRVLGTTPRITSHRVAQAVLGSRGKTLVTLKHFPGHGQAVGDSHTSVPVAKTSYEAWLQGAALPFRAGIATEADMVMFGHLHYPKVDQAQPRSLKNGTTSCVTTSILEALSSPTT